MSGLVWSVVILVTILFGTSCVDNAESMLLPSNVKLQSGDIVLRCGSGVTCKVEGGKWMLDLGK